MLHQLEHALKIIGATPGAIPGVLLISLPNLPRNASSFLRKISFHQTTNYYVEILRRIKCNSSGWGPGGTVSTDLHKEQSEEQNTAKILLLGARVRGTGVGDCKYQPKPSAYLRSAELGLMVPAEPIRFLDRMCNSLEQPPSERTYIVNQTPLGRYFFDYLARILAMQQV